MFNACRRGTVSLTKVLRAASSSNHFVPTIRPAKTILSLQRGAAPAISSRFFHVSLRLNSFGAAEAYDESVYHEEAAPKRSKDAVEVEQFTDLITNNLVHESVMKVVTETMGLETLTDVQKATINPALAGTDIIAQARTGTGKTLGFLIPTIQNILKKLPDLARLEGRSKRVLSPDIRAIIISPTRELADQIATEAEKLCSRTHLRVQVATGGTQKGRMLTKLRREGCHLLVATPGRLKDILTDPVSYKRISAPRLNTLILDEADRLLDEGFSQEIREIQSLLPKRAEVDRQTLLFSATVPREVMSLVRSTLKPKFLFVQTVKPGEIATHEKVPQSAAIVRGHENLLPTLLEICKRGLKDAEVNSAESRPFKAIVYFQSTAVVNLAYKIFKNLTPNSWNSEQHILWPAEISQIHGQLPQAERTLVSDKFRKAKSAILFSTDVTARGMDFPNVSHVIQVGLPSNREQYIHRIGRTGRGDNTGNGYVIIGEAEKPDAGKFLRGLPIVEDKSLETAKVDMSKESQVPGHVAETLNQIATATHAVPRFDKVKAYMATISQAKGRNAISLATSVNNWTKYGWGFEKPPSLSHALASKLGLTRIPGMNIGLADEDDVPKRRNDRYSGEGHFKDRHKNYGGSYKHGFERNADRRQRASRW